MKVGGVEEYVDRRLPPPKPDLTIDLCSLYVRVGPENTRGQCREDVAGPINTGEDIDVDVDSASGPLSAPCQSQCSAEGVGDASVA